MMNGKNETVDKKCSNTNNPRLYIILVLSLIYKLVLCFPDFSQLVSNLWNSARKICKQNRHNFTIIALSWILSWSEDRSRSIKRISRKFTDWQGFVVLFSRYRQISYLNLNDRKINKNRVLFGLSFLCSWHDLSLWVDEIFQNIKDY